jgi:hypothetical protein
MESVHLVVIFFVFTILSSLFFVTAQDINSSNITNQINKSTNLKSTNNTTLEKDSVSILIKSPSDVDLGTRIPDGSEKAYINAVSLDLSADVDSDLSVKCDGDLSATDNPSNTISLNYFEYDGFDNASLSKRPFTTSYSHVKSWQGNITVPINLYLTVPIGTKPGTYSTTIYYLVS